MKKSNNHLNIDLGFLDKKEPLRVAPKNPEQPTKKEPNWRFYDSKNANPNSGKQYNWKSILVVGGIILFFGWVIFSDSENSNNITSSNNTSNYGTTNSNINNNLSTGQYSCSSYNSDKAEALKPTITKQEIDNEEKNLENRIAVIKVSAEKIDNTRIDDSNQNEINRYNKMVSDHNAELEALKQDSALYDQKLHQFNTAIDKYNNYLAVNCTKNF